MSKFIILLVVAATLIEGYLGASFDPWADMQKEVKEGVHKVFTRDVSYNQPQLDADAQGSRTGNGHSFSSGFAYSSNTDKDGKVISRGFEVTDRDGVRDVKYF